MAAEETGPPVTGAGESASSGPVAPASRGSVRARYSAWTSPFSSPSRVESSVAPGAGAAVAGLGGAVPDGERLGAPRERSGRRGERGTLGRCVTARRRRLAADRLPGHRLRQSSAGQDHPLRRLDLLDRDRLELPDRRHPGGGLGLGHRRGVPPDHRQEQQDGGSSDGQRSTQGAPGAHSRSGQSLDEGQKRRGPLRAVRAERCGECPAQAWRNHAGAGHLGRGATPQPGLERLPRGSPAPIGPLAQQRLVDRDRQAELVGPGVERLSAVLLEGHVPGGARPQGLAGRARDGAPGGDGEPEVCHPEPTIAPHQEVLRLDVPVDEAGVVDGLQPPRGLEEHPADLRRAPRSPVEPAPQRLPLDVLERQIDLVLPGPHVVHRQHVGMGHPGERLGLRDQPLAPPVGVIPRGTEELQRDPPVQGEIVGAVDDAHAAAAQAVQDDVPAEGGSTRKAGHRPAHPVVRRAARRASLGGRRTAHLS